MNATVLRNEPFKIYSDIGVHAQMAGSRSEASLDLSACTAMLRRISHERSRLGSVKEGVVRRDTRMWTGQVCDVVVLLVLDP